MKVTFLDGPMHAVMMDVPEERETCIVEEDGDAVIKDGIPKQPLQSDPQYVPIRRHQYNRVKYWGRTFFQYQGVIAGSP